MKFCFRLKKSGHLFSKNRRPETVGDLRVERGDKRHRDTRPVTLLDVKGVRQIPLRV